MFNHVMIGANDIEKDERVLQRSIGSFGSGSSNGTHERYGPEAYFLYA